MTPFDTWVKETAAAMVAPTEEEYDYPEAGCGTPPDWDLLRKRFAIALVQARALECRQIGASLLIKQPGTLKQIADGLNDRSRKLEEIGMKMAEGKWAPEEEENLGPRLVN
jgi:hypothetical protein